VSSWTGSRPDPAPGGETAEAAPVGADAVPVAVPVDVPVEQQPGAHGVHLSDRRGLTAVGAVALALALGTAGGLVDVVTGSGLRTVFAVCFVAGCGLAALLVHREDLVAAVVIPPLVYCVLALLAGAVDAATGSQSLLVRQAIQLTDALVLGAPVLLTATGAALVIAVGRAVTGRR
jgi:hypothetical protein